MAKHKLLATGIEAKLSEVFKHVDGSALFRRSKELGFWFDSAEDATKAEANLSLAFPNAKCRIESPPEPETEKPAKKSKKVKTKDGD